MGDQDTADVNESEDNSEKGHLQISKMLFEPRADANIMVNDIAMSLLYIYILVTMAMGISIAQVLLEHGGYVKTKDVKSCNAIMTAELFSHHALTVFFVEHSTTMERLSEELKQFVNVRVEKNHRIPECIENEILLIYRNHTPVFSKIISQCTNALKNLEKTAVANYTTEPNSFIQRCYRSPSNSACYVRTQNNFFYISYRSIKQKNNLQ